MKWSPAAGACPYRRRGLAEARRAADLPSVRLCRRRQDDARPSRSPKHTEGEAVFAAFTGKAALVHALKGLPRRAHHPQPHLPSARARKRGGRRPSSSTRTAPPRKREPRSSSTNARWSTRNSAAIFSPSASRSWCSAIPRSCRRSRRRLLHRSRARRHADRGAPPGGGQSDHPLVDDRARRRAGSPTAPTATAASSAATRSSRRRSSSPTRSSSAATSRDGATTPASGSCSSDGARLPSPGDKLVCLRNARKRGLLNGSLWHVDRARKPRKGLLRYTLSPEEGEMGKRRTVVSINPAFFDGTASRALLSPSAAAPTSSTSATCSPSTRRRARSGTTSTCSTRALPSASTPAAGSTPASPARRHGSPSSAERRRLRRFRLGQARKNLACPSVRASSPQETVCPAERTITLVPSEPARTAHLRAGSSAAGCPGNRSSARSRRAWAGPRPWCRAARGRRGR